MALFAEISFYRVLAEHFTQQVVAGITDQFWGQFTERCHCGIKIET